MELHARLFHWYDTILGESQYQLILRSEDVSRDTKAPWDSEKPRFCRKTAIFQEGGY